MTFLGNYVLFKRLLHNPRYVWEYDSFNEM